MMIRTEFVYFENLNAEHYEWTYEDNLEYVNEAIETTLKWRETGKHRNKQTIHLHNLLVLKSRLENAQ